MPQPKLFPSLQKGDVLDQSLMVHAYHLVWLIGSGHSQFLLLGNMPSLAISWQHLSIKKAHGTHVVPHATE